MKRTIRQRVVRAGRHGWRVVRVLVLALVTPLLEKNSRKQAGPWLRRVPVVLSMARVVVLMFAVVLAHQIARSGVAGWPEATLAIAIVTALPLVGALERLDPAETVRVAKSVVSRFGEGATRSIGKGISREPHKRDDHRDDDGFAEAGLAPAAP